MRERRCEVEAREPGPLAVWLEQLRGLVPLDPAAAQARHQLDQRQVADEPAVIAPQPFETDDSRRPGPETPFALDERGDALGRHGAQTLEIARAADADERGGTPRVQPELTEPHRREPGKRRGGWRLAQRGAVDARTQRTHDLHLELARTAGLDQLSTERTQQRLRHGREPQLAHALEGPRRLSDHWIAREPAQELRVIGVDRNDETQPLEALLALGTQHDPTVDELPHRADLDAISGTERRRERAVAQVARRIARVLQRLGEREGAGGANDPLERQRLEAEAVSASTPRS